MRSTLGRNRCRSSWLTIIGLMFFFCTLSVVSAQQRAVPPVTLELLYKDVRLQGRPLSWDRERLFLLSRAGIMIDLPMSEVQEYRQINDQFQPLLAAHIKTDLRHEFGNRFEVTSSGPFLVVHAPGKAAIWSARFDDFYRSFHRYFQVRGFQLHDPEFPLVAIVWESQADFQRAVAAEGHPVSDLTVGCYLLSSNRVHLYDQGVNSLQWQQSLATIVHEAAHQIAFNTGIHSRWSPPSRWIVEGLGTVFEAPGVWDSRQYPLLKDRINVQRWQDYRKWQQAGRPENALAILLQTDRPFSTNPIAAYAEAWALSFYLIECYPREYAQYLQRTMQREPFTEYTSEQRLKDFAASFGNDLRLLDARYQRFMSELKLE